jgi:hypothetical protein
MSTFKNSIMVLIYPKDEIRLSLVHIVLHSAGKWNRPGAGNQQRAKASHRRRRAYFRRCWWMRVKSVAFGRGWSIDNARSQKRSEERLLDEQSWSRMDDEGCPNVSQQPYPGQEMIREKKTALMKRRRLMSLLYKVFVVPHPGGISSICFACITKCVVPRYVKKEKT